MQKLQICVRPLRQNYASSLGTRMLRCTASLDAYRQCLPSSLPQTTPRACPKHVIQFRRSLSSKHPLQEESKPSPELPDDSRRFTFRGIGLDGNIHDISVLRTPKAKQNVLERELGDLNLGNHEYGCRWYLDKEGDAIHAIRFSPADVIKPSIAKINELADEKKHHPHISHQFIDSKAEPDLFLTVLTITCTTHQPRGLSKRDMDLAREIDKILDASVILGFESSESEGWVFEAPVAAEINALVAEHLQKHRAAMACAVCKK